VNQTSELTRRQRQRNKRDPLLPSATSERPAPPCHGQSLLPCNDAWNSSMLSFKENRRESSLHLAKHRYNGPTCKRSSIPSPPFGLNKQEKCVMTVWWCCTASELCRQQPFLGESLTDMRYCSPCQRSAQRRQIVR